MLTYGNLNNTPPTEVQSGNKDLNKKYYAERSFLTERTTLYESITIDPLPEITEGQGFPGGLA